MTATVYRPDCMWWTCTTCPNQKRAYPSRKTAKTVLKSHPERRRMHIYRCGNGWHLGHPPGLLRTGHITRQDIYRKA